MLLFRVLCLVLLLVGTCEISLGAEEKEPAKSTSGVEIPQTITKFLKPTAKERKEHRQKKKDSEYYIKKNKQITELNLKKKMKQKELDFLQSRLEIKKQKLNDLTSKQPEKGETK